MRDEHRGSCRDRRVAEQVHDLVAQRLGSEDVECREGLVEQQDSRFLTQRPGDADPLPHATGEFARDTHGRGRATPPARGCALPFAAARQRGTPRASSGSATFSAAFSQGRSAKLWNTRAVSAIEPGQRVPVGAHLARRRGDQPGDDAQQRRLAAARRADQGQHLAGPHVERHVVAPLRRHRSACRHRPGRRAVQPSSRYFTDAQA